MNLREVLKKFLGGVMRLLCALNAAFTPRTGSRMTEAARIAKATKALALPLMTNTFSLPARSPSSLWSDRRIWSCRTISTANMTELASRSKLTGTRSPPLEANTVARATLGGAHASMYL